MRFVLETRCTGEFSSFPGEVTLELGPSDFEWFALIEDFARSSAAMYPSEVRRHFDADWPEFDPDDCPLDYVTRLEYSELVVSVSPSSKMITDVHLEALDKYSDAGVMSDVVDRSQLFPERVAS